LENTKDLIEKERNEKETTCDLHVADLGNLNDLSEISTLLFSGIKEGMKFNRFIFINNAGSLGQLTNIGHPDIENNSLMQLSQAINLNVTSCFFLTSEIVRKFKTNYFSNFGIEKIDIINISSLAAIQPFETWGLYCAGKAARDMFHQVLALEHKDSVLKSLEHKDSVLKSLNYAPGPLDTDMQEEIRDSPTVNKQTQEYFIDLKNNNKLVDASISALKLVSIIVDDSYESGSHIDFYD
jgi:sepiapterin reductase